MDKKEKKPMSFGFVEFDCTWPAGLENCPIHTKNPNAGFMDCRYNLPLMTDGKSIGFEKKEKDKS